ncbi:transcriptional regulator [Pseudonocardia cypriaca]|uniref:Transcriptional regulator n=1 Tax=Pseudonocardia cypriaca TaxID=882449 RepID=A0A543FSL3_9PSEU|nr:transcriptional regulator [Pseudonocardia cypriaca]
MDGVGRAVEQLTELGFSQYEARAYVGLLGAEPMTGYALANRTGIPQPKVYETLRRLEAKNAVGRVGDDPARFVAVPAEQLLSTVDAQFRARVIGTKQSLAEIDQRSAQRAHVLPSLTDWDSIATRAADMLRQAGRHVYLSTHAEQLARFDADIADAQARGVEFDLLCFGSSKVTVPRGRMLQHASTEGMVYRHHQARHLAVVVDSTDALWALAPNGSDWDAAVAADPLFTALVKGFIRHDLDVQQIYADFPEELRARYGPGLQQLRRPADPTSAQPSAPIERTSRGA